MTRMKMQKGSSFWPNEVTSGRSATTNQGICLKEKFISDDCLCASPQRGNRTSDSKPLSARTFFSEDTMERLLGLCLSAALFSRSFRSYGCNRTNCEDICNEGPACRGCWKSCEDKDKQTFKTFRLAPAPLVPSFVTVAAPKLRVSVTPTPFWSRRGWAW
jgi:hypothetical protein